MDKTPSKRLKKSKVNKKRRTSADTSKKDDKGVLRKQKELMRVLHVKTFQLQNGSLSYLDYMELREELFRLNALKEMFARM